jgi:hypothetical protein
MNRIALVVSCLAMLTLAGCGDGKKPMNVRDKSNVKPVEVGGGSEKGVQEGADPGNAGKP